MSMQYLNPGTMIQIGKTDQDRDAHPPKHLDGTLGLVARYVGWTSKHLTETVGEFDYDEEVVYGHAPEDAIHRYDVVVRDMGYFEIVDYEISSTSYRGWRQAFA